MPNELPALQSLTTPSLANTPYNRDEVRRLERELEENARGQNVFRTAADKQKAAKIPLWQGVIAYFSNALQAVGAISRMGAAKHNNGVMPTKWRDYPAEVYADALARHITEEGKGDLYDSESNMLHAGHEAWNALARLEKLLEVHPLVKPADPAGYGFGV